MANYIKSFNLEIVQVDNDNFIVNAIGSWNWHDRTRKTP